jgi:hypothetical protein
MPIAAFVQLMTVTVELNKDDTFTEFESILKQVEPDLSFNSFSAYVRSRYLITQCMILIFKLITMIEIEYYSNIY